MPCKTEGVVESVPKIDNHHPSRPPLVTWFLSEAAKADLSKFKDEELSKIGQMTDAKCGPLSLLVICELVGIKTDVEETSKLSGLSGQGTTRYPRPDQIDQVKIVTGRFTLRKYSARDQAIWFIEKGEIKNVSVKDQRVLNCTYGGQKLPTKRRYFEAF